MKGLVGIKEIKNNVLKMSWSEVGFQPRLNQVQYLFPHLVWTTFLSVHQV